MSVESVREAIRAHGERYLKRVYTSRELADCRKQEQVDPESLAARFAAKEATFKVLRPGDQGVPWTDVEVRRDPAGWTDLELGGRAATLADGLGVTGLALSLTHEAGLASAVVVAEMPAGPIMEP